MLSIGPEGNDDAQGHRLRGGRKRDLVAGSSPARPSGRATLPGLVVPVLVALDRLGLSREWEQELRATSAALAPRRDALVAPGGLPEELARRIGRTFPLVYGSSGIGAVAARWWKDEVNRNAKSPAFAAELPNLAYGELAGWGQSGDVTRQMLTLVQLRHGGESQRTADLFAAVTAATDEVMADVLEVEAAGARRSHPLLRPRAGRPTGLAAPGGAGGRGPGARPRPSTTRWPARRCPRAPDDRRGGPARGGPARAGPSFCAASADQLS